MPLLKGYFEEKRGHLEKKRLQEAEKKATARGTRILLTVLGSPSEWIFIFSILAFTIFLVIKLNGVFYLFLNN